MKLTKGSKQIQDKVLDKYQSVLDINISQTLNSCRATLNMLLKNLKNATES